MTLPQVSLLVGSSLAAGTINAVAGGGSFFSFPALIFAGLPSIPANATSTIALWPGTMASVGAYRKDILRERRLLPRLMAMSIIGGLIGAMILVNTPERTFNRLIPWLLLTATVMFAFGDRISSWIGRREAQAGSPAARIGLSSCAIQLVIAIYAGYFGGGASMLMLAMLSLSGMTEIHSMNGIKTLLSATQNFIALWVFIAKGIVFWPEALLMMAGAIAGGYGGAYLAKKTDPKAVRRIVIAVGALMTAYFFVR